jgi:hypothetical protein
MAAAGIVRYIIELTDKTKAGVQSATRGAKALEAESKDAAKAVDHLGDESAQTGRQVAKMGTQAGRSASDTKKLGSSTAKTGASLVAAAGPAAAFGAALAAVGLAAVSAVSGMVALSQEVADFRNDIGDAATRSGLAAETIQGLRLAAEGAGLTFEALTPGLDQFGSRLSQAAEGTGRTAEAFAALGVEVTDSAGNLRNADAVFRETVGALNEMEPGAERSALAVEALGRSGTKLLQALSGGTLEGFTEQARLFGVDVGPKAAKAAGDWQRATAELGLVTRGLKGAFVDTFGIGSKEVQQFTQLAVFGFTAVSSLAETLPDVFDQMALMAVIAFDVIETKVASLLARLEAVARVSAAVLSGDLQGIGQEMAAGRQSIAAADRANDAALIARDEQAEKIGDMLGDAVGAALVDATAAVLRLRSSRSDAATPGGAGGAGGDGALSTPTEPAEGAAAASGTLTRAELAAAAAAAAGGPQMVGGLDPGARGAVDPTAAAANRAFLEAQLAATQQSRGDTIRGAAGVAQSVLSGNLGRGLSQVGSMVGGAAGAALGPAGAIVGGLQFIGEQGAEGIKETLEGVKDGLIAALEALPELIGNVLPEFAVTLVAELIPALIKSAPQLFRALLFELPQAIADALAEVIGVESDTGRGALRGATFGAIIGGVLAGAVSGGLLTGAGVKAGAVVGGGIGATVARVREGRSERNGRDAARTTETGRTASGRAEDRLAMSSTRPRRRPTVPVSANPFDEFSRQFSAQAGNYGRFTSRIGGVT